MFGYENVPASVLGVDTALDDNVVAVVEAADFGSDVAGGVGDAACSDDRHLKKFLLLILFLSRLPAKQNKPKFRIFSSESPTGEN